MTWAFEKCILHLLHRATQVANGMFEANQGDGEITPRQFIELAAVAANEGLSQTGLVQICGIDRSTLSDVVKRLTRAGHLKRRRSKADLRAYSVSLTPKGTATLAKAERRAQSIDTAMLGALPVEARGALLRALTAISEIETSQFPAK